MTDPRCRPLHRRRQDLWRRRVARYVGDGILTYFGWPTAHEEDAERAVRAAFPALSAGVTTTMTPVPKSMSALLSEGWTIQSVSLNTFVLSFGHRWILCTLVRRDVGWSADVRLHEAQLG